VPISLIEAGHSVIDELTSSTASPSFSALIAILSISPAISSDEADVSDAAAEVCRSRYITFMHRVGDLYNSPDVPILILPASVQN